MEYHLIDAALHIPPKRESHQSRFADFGKFVEQQESRFAATLREIRLVLQLLVEADPFFRRHAARLGQKGHQLLEKNAVTYPAVRAQRS